MNSIASSPAEISTGIDWLTCTALRPTRVAALLAFGKEWIDEEVGSGGTPKPFHFQGFSGRTAGGVGLGFNGSRALVKLSGPAAREHAASAIAFADNVSRLDVQTTVRDGGLRSDYAASQYYRLLGVRRGRGRPICRSLICTSEGGSSLYIGKGVSDQYGRVYNKSAEERERCELPRWRFEVEYKRKPALAAATAYARAACKETWCTAQVHAWFGQRGLMPPFDAGSDPTNLGASRGDSSQARRLHWLKRGVRPVVVKLAHEFGWPDILALLGVPMSYSDRYVNEVLAGPEDL